VIDKIEISGSNYKVSDSFRKYAEKRIGKLDRYLPRGSKKDVVAKIVVTEVDRAHGNKYEVSAAMEIPGGKVLTARDECSNVFAGIDIIEAKLKGKASVAATSRLKSYPVCLAAKGDVSLEMERVMSAMGNSVKAERVLQVNVDHPAVKNLKKLEGNMFDDAVTVLYNEALLAEGYRTEQDFIPALNRVLEYGAAAAVKAAPAKTAAKKPAAAAKKTAAAAKKPAAKKPASTAAKKPDGADE